MSAFRFSMPRRAWSAPLAAFLMFVAALVVPASAQTEPSYSCFPNCNSSDGRMLILAGAGTKTLAGDTIIMKITSPGYLNTVEIGIFDGDSRGKADNGGVPLRYTLYADPSGEGRNLTQEVATWSGDTMPDNAWTRYILSNDSRAKAPSGTYIYALKILNTDPSVDQSWSGFKVRTDGAIGIRGYQSFAVFVPLANAGDISVIYPTGLANVTNTTYDGSWVFYLDNPVAASSLTVWDGDMDHGDFTGTILDTDDPDTPNEVPAWAAGTEAVAEGVAIGNPYTDSTGTRSTTGAPADDNKFAAYSRAPSVWYEIIHPNGVHYENRNPSGNLEWEQFVLSTKSNNRNERDHRVDSLPAGVYVLKMNGMDLHNLNAWRFFNEAVGQAASPEVIGVDKNGDPVVPLKPYDLSGTIYYDTDNDGVHDNSEPGIPNIRLLLASDFNLDGTIDSRSEVETDTNGYYIFPNVGPGKHTITVDTETLSDDVDALRDNDGTRSPNSTTVTTAGGDTVAALNFSYRRSAPECRTYNPRGYWSQKNCRWPTQYIKIGGRTCNRSSIEKILWSPTRGDMTYELAAELIAAKLNCANGRGNRDIEEVIEDADEWLRYCRVGSKVSSRSSAWRNKGKGLCEKLNDYNMGRSSRRWR